MNINFLSLIPSVFKLMMVAEQIGGAGTGAEKKEAVKACLTTIPDVMVAVSGGGQKDTWKQIDGMIDGLSGLL